MLLLNNLDQLDGKTIKSTKLVDCEESLAILFTDDTCAFFMVNIGHEDEHEIYIEDDVSDCSKRNADIISDTEYAAIVAKNAEYERMSREKRERDLLATLKKKYD